MNKKIKLIIFLFLLTFNLQAKDRIGTASYYHSKFEGRLTSNGEVFSNSNLTCASNKYRMGTRLKITNLRNNKFVYVRVNDTGKLHGRTIDLSQRAFNNIGVISRGILHVRIQKIEPLNYTLNYEYHVRARKNCSLYK